VQTYESIKNLYIWVLFFLKWRVAPSLCIEKMHTVFLLIYSTKDRQRVYMETQSIPPKKIPAPASLRSGATRVAKKP
jgi:hypothetical protein